MGGQGPEEEGGDRWEVILWLLAALAGVLATAAALYEALSGG